MKIYTIYSDSHRELAKLQRDSFNKCGLSVTARKAPQLCSGDYGSEGSEKFWKLNIEYFIELCERGEPFLYVDADVMCIQNPTKELEIRSKGISFLSQLDKRIFGFPLRCTGIMYIKPHREVLRMFEWMYLNVEKYKNDQKALNRYLGFSFPYWGGILPETYYSINFDNGNKVWDGNTPLKFKKRDYKLIHLNWTIGENKLKIYNQFRRYYENL